MNIKSLNNFLKANPLMSYLPITKEGDVILEGKVDLCHRYEQYPLVQQFIELKITIPKGYPYAPPVFEEIGGFIPRIGDYHINPDGSLCLGSPFRVDKFLRANSDFERFFNLFFIAYIYAVVLKKSHKIEFIFGELKHGTEGELEDFSSTLSVHDKPKTIACVEALSKKKRIANKEPCPCNCGIRLGKCQLHHELNLHRKSLPRSWYKKFKTRLK